MHATDGLSTNIFAISIPMIVIYDIEEIFARILSCFV